jgi:hypothetical protein
MKYSGPIAAILERETARIESRHFPGATRLIGEMGRLMNVVQALEAVALNRDPTDNDAAHMKKTHDAGVRLAKAIEASRQRGNEILNEHNAKVSAQLREATGLREPDTLAGIMRQSELRTVVRGMKPQARHDFLRNAVKAKDVETVSALFNAPAVVTGIDPNLLAVGRAEYERAVAPDLMDDVEFTLETDSALQAVTKAASRAANEAQDAVAMQEFMRADAAALAAKAAFDSSL